MKAGTGTVIAVVPAVAIPWRKSVFRERKSGFKKSRKARKRPTIALHGPLPLFRDIYPWKAKGPETGRFSRHA